MTSLRSIPSVESLDLAGVWRVTCDGRSHDLALPGSLQESRLGGAVTPDTAWTGSIFDRSYFTAPEYAPYRQPGNIKVPFWLQPETHFTGEAVYERTIDIPATWAGKRSVLILERPHWRTTVWLDDREIGTRDSLSVPHRYDLGTTLEPGRHVLRIRVDNRLEPDIGENSHSIADHTQGNWNGIVGAMRLDATAPVWIDTLWIGTDAVARAVEVRGRVGHLGKASQPERVGLAVGTTRVDVTIQPDGSFSHTIFLGGGAALWDECEPQLHTLTASLENGEHRAVRFGLRSIAADGRQLTINGRPLFLRGTLDCAAFPRSGHPPMQETEWRRVFSAIQAHGLNHVRFHSWCPPEAAFAVADELGLYLQVEVASWPNWSTTLGDGKPVDAWTDAETARILDTYGNHPSFVLLCAGNEPGGDRHAAWLSGWVARQRSADPRRLYTAGAGWPEVPENQFHVRSEPRIHQWAEGLTSRINARPPETQTDYGDFIRARAVPVVAHEIGQWCAYPNFAEMTKYTGYLKPRNFEIFAASLSERGMGELAHDFLIASGKLQALCYKEEIESALRTREMGGFQLLGLSDFPGQGTAPVGVLDAFWEEKGYIRAAEFRRFCAATVPLARLSRRVFTADDHLTADLDVSHYGARALGRGTARWRLVDAAGCTVVEGELVPDRAIDLGLSGLGRIDLPLRGLPAPARYRLVMSLPEVGAENDWDVWVYPAANDVDATVPSTILAASRFDGAVEERLGQGGVVLLTIPPAMVAPDAKRGPIALGFSSIFWNTAWTNRQAPHTLGVLCDPRHPALAEYPTEPHSNWQWWYAVRHASPMILDALPRELRPIVQVVDDWFTNRKLALVFEARVGDGRLLVTSIDVNHAVLDPVRRQLRASLLRYAASAQFQPIVQLTPDQIKGLFAP